MKNLLACVLSIFAISASAEKNTEWTNIFIKDRPYVCAIQVKDLKYEVITSYMDFKDTAGLYLSPIFGGNDRAQLSHMSTDGTKHTFFFSNDGLMIFELDTWNLENLPAKAFTLLYWPSQDTNFTLEGFCEQPPEFLFN